MKGGGILFVDDDRRILAMVQEYLTEVGYRVEVEDNGARALERVKDHPYGIVFTDIKMPEFDGLDLLKAIKEFRPETEVIIVTGHGSMESVIQAMKQGSYDYLQKPFKLSVLKTLIDRIFEEKKQKEEKTVLRAPLRIRSRYDALVGISASMQQVFEQLEHIKTASPNALILGESGTGKELTAQVIHRTGPCAGKPFIGVSCSSLLRGLPENRHPERLRDVLASAQQGTVFLNEVCELPRSAQLDLAGILREAKTESAPPRLAARVLAATNRDLKDALRKGALAQELVDTLSGAVLQMPALRERKEDICLLINHFLHQYSAEKEQKVLAVAPDAMGYLLDYDWPGNVIQLENVIERAFALGVEQVIQIEDLPAEIRTAGEISRLH